MAYICLGWRFIVHWEKVHCSVTNNIAYPPFKPMELNYLAIYVIVFAIKPVLYSSLIGSEFHHHVVVCSGRNSTPSSSQHKLSNRRLCKLWFLQRHLYIFLYTLVWLLGWTIGRWKGYPLRGICEPVRHN